MAKNTIEDLRDHLFETLEMLKDPDKPLELDRAKSICQVSQTIINAAKVEVDFLETVSQSLGQTVPDLADRSFFRRKALTTGSVPENGKGR